MNSQTAEYKKLFEIDIMDGDCPNCHLKDVCQYASAVALDKCLFVQKSTELVFEAVAASGVMEAQDELFIRSIATVFVAVKLAEMQVRVNGATQVGLNGMGYTQIYKQWLELNSKLHKMLTDMGMTPLGRKILLGAPTRKAALSLTDYLEDRYGEPDKEGEHNRFLSGPKPTESTVEAPAGGSSAENVRTATKQRAKVPVQRDADGEEDGGASGGTRDERVHRIRTDIRWALGQNYGGGSGQLL